MLIADLKRAHVGGKRRYHKWRPREEALLFIVTLMPMSQFVDKHLASHQAAREGARRKARQCAQGASAVQQARACGVRKEGARGAADDARTEPRCYVESPLSFCRFSRHVCDSAHAAARR